MKKIFGIFALCLLLVFAFSEAEAFKTFTSNSLIGGIDGSLDNKDGDSLTDGDTALVITAAGTYFYMLDGDSGLTENSPSIIAPDLNPGTKRWILKNFNEADPVVKAISGIIKSNGSTISAASPGVDYLLPNGDGSGLSGIVTTEQNNLETDGAAGIATNELAIGTGGGTVNYVLMSGEGTILSTGVFSVSDDVLDFSEFKDAMTLDTNTTIGTGSYSLTFQVNNSASNGIDINGTGAFADDLLHIHQHTGNPTGGRALYVEAVDPDINPIVFFEAEAADLTSDVIVLEIGAVDNDDANYIPLQIIDDVDGTPDTLFKVDYLGTVFASGNIELGSETDTTISRSGAGAIQVEGIQVMLSGVATTSDLSDYCPSETYNVKAAGYTVGTDDSCECYGGVITVTAAATLTMCDNLADGMHTTLISNVAGAVHFDPQSDDLIILDGTTLDDGDKASSQETGTGEVIKCSYYNSTGWNCVSDGWSDGGA